jgi:hypothetical protein
MSLTTRDLMPNGTPPLDELVTFMKRYLVFAQPEAADFLALWIAHTHAFEAAITTPYPWVTSAVRESGKTRVLEVLDVLVRRSWFVVSMTPATVYRKGDADAPTLLLDEIDNVDMKERQEMLGALNAGYKIGAKVPRCDDKGNVHEFDVFFPKCFAGPRRATCPTRCTRGA